MTPRPSAAGSMALMKAMKTCPYHSLNIVKGCGRGHYGLRCGTPLSYLDCLTCLRRYGRIRIWTTLSPQPISVPIEHFVYQEIDTKSVQWVARRALVQILRLSSAKSEPPDRV
jgi:hypothetical protein